jgi:uncharacterized protein (TIGR03435 family)
MKSVMRSLVVLTLLSTALTAQAQDLAGQWQGTLQAGKELRLVFMITRNAAGGGLSGTLHSIDQGGQGIVATVTAQGPTVRLAVAPAGITFEGKLAADGNAIEGTFTQGQGSLPLRLVRATKETAWALPAPPRTMAADAPTVFEVASIRPSNPGGQGMGLTVRGAEVVTINTTLNDLISVAYGVHAKQIIGGPEWMSTERFDVTGRPQAEGIPSQAQIRGLLRSLIETRFALTSHREKRELGAYALTTASGGPKMTRNDANPNGLPGVGFKGLGAMVAVNATPADLAMVLQLNVLDRPVIDRTAVQGRYDFTLTWTPDDSQFRSMRVNIPPPAADPNAPPGLFTAIQEQLGLRLESTNAPVEVIVVDKVQRPEN